mmetsp:Transcript_99340/g.289921  ORF Transcript_99340/g.289921 Transcript_99340/m.289921 type:complete len:202 (-) Transcript_99340:79-684(-)
MRPSSCTSTGGSFSATSRAPTLSCSSSTTPSAATSQSCSTRGPQPSLPSRCSSSESRAPSSSPTLGSRTPWPPLGRGCRQVWRRRGSTTSSGCRSSSPCRHARCTGPSGASSTRTFRWPALWTWCADSPKTTPEAGRKSSWWTGSARRTSRRSSTPSSSTRTATSLRRSTAWWSGRALSCASTLRSRAVAKTTSSCCRMRP